MNVTPEALPIGHDNLLALLDVMGSTEDRHSTRLSICRLFARPSCLRIGIFQYKLGVGAHGNAAEIVDEARFVAKFLGIDGEALKKTIEFFWGDSSSKSKEKRKMVFFSYKRRLSSIERELEFNNAWPGLDLVWSHARA